MKRFFFRNYVGLSEGKITNIPSILSTSVISYPIIIHDLWLVSHIPNNLMDHTKPNRDHESSVVPGVQISNYDFSAHIELQDGVCVYIHMYTYITFHYIRLD